ncbi:phosphate acyltransferase, partial [Hungatella sp.]
GCIVEGPLGFDNAVSREAAEHKGIDSQVAGQADIIVVPDLCSGNILTKSIIFFTNMPSCGTLLGTSVPVIAVSRTDTPENKYRGILVSLLCALTRG